MSSARDTDPPRLPRALPHAVERRDDHARALERLGTEMERGAQHGPPGGYGGSFFRPGLARRRERAELESLRQAARRWSEEIERLREGYEDLREVPAKPHARGEREESLERVLAEREAELRALRGAAANRELDLQREHDAETRHQQEEIASLKKRLGEAESGEARDDELREVKRLAYERERELRRTHAEKLSEIEREAERRVSALRSQREADNRSLIERHATEKARRDEELESLRLRRLSEARVYSGRIEELAHERAEERSSLEEAVAKLREKHEAERARLQERVESLEEALEEQESITVGLLGELGYVQNPQGSRGLSEPPPPPPPGALEIAGKDGADTRIQEALRELRSISAPGNLLREGLALFNETEHVKVVGAISKSLGEPEVYAVVETHNGTVETPVITLAWPGLGWRRYVSEPRSATEPQVYLAGQGENDAQLPLPGSGPNARLDGRGLLSLGVRPL